MFDFDLDDNITTQLELGDGARWPLPRLRGLDPAVLGEHVGGSRRAVELGYEGLGRRVCVPVLAVQAGEVAAAFCNAHGFAVTIDHGGWATHYANLSKLFVASMLPHHSWQRQRVNAGEIIGYVSTVAPHLLFEVWRRGALGDIAADPYAHLKAWPVSNDAGAFSMGAHHG